MTLTGLSNLSQNAQGLFGKDKGLELDQVKYKYNGNNHTLTLYDGTTSQTINNFSQTEAQKLWGDDFDKTSASGTFQHPIIDMDLNGDGTLEANEVFLVRSNGEVDDLTGKKVGTDKKLDSSSAAKAGYKESIDFDLYGGESPDITIHLGVGSDGTAQVAIHTMNILKEMAKEINADKFNFNSFSALYGKDEAVALLGALGKVGEAGVDGSAIDSTLTAAFDKMLDSSSGLQTFAAGLAPEQQVDLFSRLSADIPAGSSDEASLQTLFKNLGTNGRSAILDACSKDSSLASKFSQALMEIYGTDSSGLVSLLQGDAGQIESVDGSTSPQATTYTKEANVLLKDINAKIATADGTTALSTWSSNFETSFTKTLTNDIDKHTSFNNWGKVHTGQLGGAVHDIANYFLTTKVPQSAQDIEDMWTKIGSLASMGDGTNGANLTKGQFEEICRRMARSYDQENNFIADGKGAAKFAGTIS